MGYADVTPVGDLLRTPAAEAGGIEDLIAGAGARVQAVDWIFEQVTGHSLVRAVIEPITGDWSRIAANGEAWRSAGQAMLALADNLAANLAELQRNWSGAASDSFATHVQRMWCDALRSQAELAGLAGSCFDTVAEEGRRLCRQALQELEKLVDRLIEAIAATWLPFAGWARAGQLMWDAFELFQAIMAIIQAVQDIIRAAQDLLEAVSQIGSALEAIPQVRNLGDALAVAERLNAGVGRAGLAVDAIGRGAGAVQDGLDAADGLPAPAGSPPGGGPPVLPAWKRRATG